MPAAAPKTLAQALLKVQADMPKLQKDSINPHFGSKFIGLHALVETVLPILQKHGIVLSQVLDNADGAPALRTILLHAESGDAIEGTCPLPQGLNAQQMGGAVTYFRRYGLMSALSLVADEDDDGNAATKAQASVPAPAPAPAPLPASDGGALGGAVLV